MRAHAWAAVLIAAVVLLGHSQWTRRWSSATSDEPGCHASDEQAYCANAYPSCGDYFQCVTRGGCSDHHQDFRCLCPAGETCVQGQCKLGTADAGMAEMVSCVMGDPFCPTGFSLIGASNSSSDQSGCYLPAEEPLNPVTPPFTDPPPGMTCAQVGEIDVSCDNSPNCSFCWSASARVPPGCHAN